MSQPRVYKWPARLVVMRHAESEANFRRDHIERSNSGLTHVQVGTRDVDVPLTDKGREQARQAGRFLASAGAPFDAVYVSPYHRTRETAGLAIEPMDPRPALIIEERVREKEFGVLEGLTRTGVRTLQAQEHDRRLMVGKYYYRPPGGESYPDVNLRVHSFLGTLVREHAGQRILVVTHSVVVLSFRRLLERLEEEKVLELDRHNEPRNASLSVYESLPGETGGSGLMLKDWNLIPWTAGASDRLARG
ncbi:MAG TPA: histidine phosphatase family protein [Candidatus Cryosericum sp.]|nr:histidine phosphatase family protein [Candidatus Cryosericum sp.]